MSYSNARDFVSSVVQTEVDLRHVMSFHGAFSVLLGVVLVVVPHSFSSTILQNHIAHEFLRLYGAMNVGLGWFVWRTEKLGLTDGRLKRLICEVFSLTYFFQFLVLLRAQITVPSGHSRLHMWIGITFGVIAMMYSYMRFIKKIKSFELPDVHDS
jgi:hypothetical protein